MKYEDIYKVLQRLIEAAAPNEADTRVVASMVSQLKYNESVLTFYAKKNYDSGIVARRALGTKEEGDDANFNKMDNESRRIDRFEGESEN